MKGKIGCKVDYGGNIKYKKFLEINNQTVHRSEGGPVT